MRLFFCSDSETIALRIIVFLQDSSASPSALTCSNALLIFSATSFFVISLNAVYNSAKVYFIRYATARSSGELGARFRFIRQARSTPVPTRRSTRPYLSRACSVPRFRGKGPKDKNPLYVFSPMRGFDRLVIFMAWGTVLLSAALCLCACSGENGDDSAELRL